MGKIIKRAFSGIRALCANGRGHLGLHAGRRRYSPPSFRYPGTSDLWRQDWSNIASDFHRSVNRLELSSKMS